MMTIHDKIKDTIQQYYENYNTVLTVKHYHHGKLINRNILQAKKYCYLIEGK